MEASRKQYRALAFDPTVDNEPLARLVDATRWLRSGLLHIITGYGERSYRVVFSSLVIISTFGVLFWQGDYGEFSFTFLEAMTFSFQSFVTFVLGQPDGSTLVGEALSAVEGFIGAFFIALFVFTFTRRINR